MNATTIDLGQYIGQLIDEVREARTRRDAGALDVIIDKVQWVHEQLEAQHIQPDQDWATLQKQLEVGE